jgi:hypothetical protein
VNRYALVMNRHDEEDREAVVATTMMSDEAIRRAWESLSDKEMEADMRRIMKEVRDRERERKN